MTENTIQQTLTPTEVRQAHLTEIEASKQMIEELSDKQLEEITGEGMRGAIIDLGKRAMGKISSKIPTWGM